MDIETTGTYVRMKDAAKYCGYAYDTFRKMIGAYQLPKYGPKRNRFAVHDLDEFMREPEQFRQETRSRRGRRKQARLQY